MDPAASLHFIRPLALLLAPLAMGVWWFWQRHADPLRGWREQIAPGLLVALTLGHTTQSKGPARCLLAAWLLAVVAIAGPTWRLEPSPFADDASPMLLLLKADMSMEQPDPAPSRLVRARLKIADIAAARAGQPLGLIAYAGSAHLVLPPTRDTAVLATLAQEIDPDIMPLAGDRLDLALAEADRVLRHGGRGGSVVVLADTVDMDIGALRQPSEFPVQFLAINTAQGVGLDALRNAARILDAPVELLDVSGADVAAVVRRAAHTPSAERGERSDQWQESGYWLVPLLGMLVLLAFRRDSKAASPA